MQQPDPTPLSPPETVATTILQLSGLGGAPILLGQHQLLGDRRTLQAHPENIQLHIQPTSSKHTRKKNRRRGGNHAATEASAPWRVYTGSKLLFPLVADNPALFLDRVYHTLQHAFLACLLWLYGGQTGRLSYTFYPRSSSGFPLVAVRNLPVFGLGEGADEDDEAADLALHLQPQPPTHTELLAYGEEMRAAGYTRCVVLVGALQPTKSAMVHGGMPPGQLHGVLLRADRLRPHSVENRAFHPRAVEHGYQTCLVSRETDEVDDDRETNKNKKKKRQGHKRRRGVVETVLCLALHGQRGATNEVLPPLVGLPSLASVGLRLWRRDAIAHAIVPKIENDPHAWSEKIRAFVEANIIAAPTA